MVLVVLVELSVVVELGVVEVVLVELSVVVELGVVLVVLVAGAFAGLLFESVSAIVDAAASF